MNFNSFANKVKFKQHKNTKCKTHVVFDELQRREFLTGFHKRKLQRKKEARQKLETELKEERKQLRAEAKESYKKLVVSRRPIPELETLLKEEYEDEDATVRIEELSTNTIAKDSCLIGLNQTKYESLSSNYSIDDNDKSQDYVQDKLAKAAKNTEINSKEQLFSVEKDIKRLLKKNATKNVKKSKVFQKKNKMEKQKQKKKSMLKKKQQIKLQEMKSRKKQCH